MLLVSFSTSLMIMQCITAPNFLFSSYGSTSWTKSYPSKQDYLPKTIYPLSILILHQNRALHIIFIFFCFANKIDQRGKCVIKYLLKPDICPMLPQRGKCTPKSSACASCTNIFYQLVANITQILIPVFSAYYNSLGNEKCSILPSYTST